MKNKTVEKMIRSKLYKEFKTVEEVNIEIEEKRYEWIEPAFDEIAEELSKRDVKEISKTFRHSSLLELRSEAFKKWNIAKFFKEKGIKTFTEGLHGVKIIFGSNNTVWIRPDGTERLLTFSGYVSNYYEEIAPDDIKLNEIRIMYESANCLSDFCCKFYFDILGEE